MYQLKYLKLFESREYDKLATHCKEVWENVKFLSYILEDEGLGVKVSSGYMSLWFIDIEWVEYMKKNDMFTKLFNQGDMNQYRQASSELTRKPFFREYLNRVKEILGDEFTIKGVHQFTQSRYKIERK